MERLRCKFGFHTWEGKGKTKLCKFCGEDYETWNARMGYYLKYNDSGGE